MRPSGTGPSAAPGKGTAHGTTGPSARAGARLLRGSLAALLLLFAFATDGAADPSPVCAYCDAPLPNGTHASSCPYASTGGGGRGGGGGGGGQTVTYSSGGGSTRKSSKQQMNEAILKGLQEGLEQMNNPDPAVLRQIEETRQEGDRAHQDSVVSQQSALDQQRQKALRGDEAARSKTVRGLADSLRGLPGSADPVDLRPGGTPFFGTGGGAGAGTPQFDPSMESWRGAASSGFDTAGPFLGKAPKAPPPVPSPTRVTVEERQVPPERLSPEMRPLLAERATLKERKDRLEGELRQLEARRDGGTLPPDEARKLEDALKKVRDDLGTTLNKIDYLNFTVNASLDDPSPAAPPGTGGRP